MRIPTYFFLLIILVSFVGATPPQFVTGDFSNGLTIEVNGQSTLKANQTYTGHFHVYNSTTGVYVDNSTADCYIHIYNSSGNHIVEKQMDFDDNGMEFEVVILGGNFSVGNYDYIGFCNTSSEGGFVSSNFYVTSSGSELTEANTGILNSTVYFFMILAVLSYVGFMFVPTEKMQVKWTLFVVGFMFCLVVINLIDLSIADSLVNTSLISFFDSLTAISFIIFYGGAVLLIALWLLAFFNTILTRKRKLNENKFGMNF